MQRRVFLATTVPLVGGCVSSRPISTGQNANDTTGSSDTNGNRSQTDEPALNEIDDEHGTDDEPPSDSVDIGDENGTIDDFETLSHWSIRGGTLSADTDRSYVGSQSARVKSPTNEDSTLIERTFEEPLDVTDAAPGIAVTASDIVVPWVRLYDSTGNRIDYRRGIKGELPFMRHNVGIDAVHGDVDLSDITMIQVQVWTGDQERTVWFDDLFFVPRPKKGKVMIQFDDAHVTDYTVALPILEEHGLKAVTFVNPDYIERGTVGGDPRLSVEQTHELHDAGWTIANHTDSHPRLPELDPAAQEAEIRGGKEWLLDHGFEEGARYFAYPFGEYDATTLSLVDQYHEIGWAGGRPAQGFVSNSLLASRLGEPSAERVKEALEWTATYRGITGFFYHRLEGENKAHFEAMAGMISELENAGHIDVILPRDVEEQYLF